MVNTTLIYINKITIVHNYCYREMKMDLYSIIEGWEESTSHDVKNLWNSLLDSPQTFQSYSALDQLLLPP